MKYLNFLIISLITLSSNSKEHNGRTFFSVNGLEGVIFSYPYPDNIKRIDSLSWTPTFSQIRKADSMVLVHSFAKLGGFASDTFCNPECPVIAKNWQNFLRQAYGFININNDSVIYLSYIWKADSMKHGDWKTERIEIFGSCGRVWSVRVDLNKSFVEEIALPEVICYDLD